MKSQNIFELAKRFLTSKEDSKGRKDFECLLAELEERGEEPDSVYLEQAKRKVLTQIYEKREKRKGSWRHLVGSMKFAASFIVFAAVSYLFYINGASIVDEAEWMTKKTDIGMRSTISLSDGSIVRLNENSTLEFPEIFDSNERVVRLYGEAFFDIVPNKEQAFKVVSDQTEVIVLGTTFNINTFQIPEITVASGTVRVADTLLKEHVVLNAGQQAIISNTEISVLDVNPEYYIGWHTRKLQFDSIPVLEVFKILERAYGVTILFEESSRNVNCLITGRYEGERIETIMKGLKNILDFAYETDVSTKTITLNIQKCKQ